MPRFKVNKIKEKEHAFIYHFEDNYLKMLILAEITIYLGAVIPLCGISVGYDAPTKIGHHIRRMKTV